MQLTANIQVDTPQFVFEANMLYLGWNLGALAINEKENKYCNATVQEMWQVYLKSL